LKPKGRRFDAIDKIQGDWQTVLDSVTKRIFRKLSKNGGDGGTGVYMWEGTTSRLMATDKLYGEFYDFYSISPKYVVNTHIFITPLAYGVLLADTKCMQIGNGWFTVTDFISVIRLQANIRQYYRLCADQRCCDQR
jgi:hypothetical protein